MIHVNLYHMSMWLTSFLCKLYTNPLEKKQVKNFISTDLKGVFMNDPNQLFAELFCNSSNKQIALLYLASFMSETESAETYCEKMRQISLLKEFFKSTQCSNREYYFQRLKNIEAILEQERAVSEWDISSEKKIEGILQ